MRPLQLKPEKGNTITMCWRQTEPIVISECLHPVVRRDELEGESERLAILALCLSTLTFLAVVILIQVHG
jgi:hypothetical protein